MIIQRGYVALRRDAYGGREWFDMATWAGAIQIAHAKSLYQDKTVSGLACASPVIRIQQVECFALEGGADVGPDGRVIKKGE